MLEKVYIITEENAYHQTSIVGVWGSLKGAKIWLKRQAKFWIKDEEELKNTIKVIDEVTNLSLTTGDTFYLELEDLGSTYYLDLEMVHK